MNSQRADLVLSAEVFRRMAPGIEGMQTPSLTKLSHGAVSNNAERFSYNQREQCLAPRSGNTQRMRGSTAEHSLQQLQLLHQVILHFNAWLVTCSTMTISAQRSQRACMSTVCTGTHISTQPGQGQSLPELPMRHLAYTQHTAYRGRAAGQHSAAAQHIQDMAALCSRRYECALNALMNKS